MAKKTDRKSLAQSITSLKSQRSDLDIRATAARAKRDDAGNRWSQEEDPGKRRQAYQEQADASREAEALEAESNAVAALLARREADLDALDKAERAETLKAESVQLAKANEATGDEVAKLLDQTGRLIADAYARNVRLQNLTYQILDLRGQPATGFVSTAGMFDLEAIASRQRSVPGARVERVVVFVPPVVPATENGARS